MTKQEMIEFIKDNSFARVTHKAFESGSYIYQSGNGYVYTNMGHLFEDWGMTDIYDGIRSLVGEPWEDGWSVYTA